MKKLPMLPVMVLESLVLLAFLGVVFLIGAVALMRQVWTQTETTREDG